MQNSNFPLNQLLDLLTKKLYLNDPDDRQILINTFNNFPEFHLGTNYFFYINPDDLTIELLDPNDPELKEMLPANLCNPTEDYQFYYLWESRENPNTDSIFFFTIY